MKLKPRDYRHVAIEYGKSLELYIDEDNEDKDVDTFNAIMHEQSGHSSSIGNIVYGVSNRSLPNINSSKIQMFLNISIKWHKFIGHGPPDPYKSQPHSLLPPPIQSSMNLLSSSSMFSSPTPGSNIGLLQLTSKVNNMEQSFGRYLLGNPLHSRIFNSNISNTMNMNVTICRPSIAGKLSRLKAENLLEEFYNDGTVTFKSATQRNVISLILDNHTTNKLVVLPTGGGKSLLFMLPARYIQHRVNVVVVPIVSLSYDLKRRCDEYDITSYIFNKNRLQELNHNYPNILFCSHEDIESTEFISFMNHIYVEKMLGSIYIDEVHTIMDWQEFRGSMKSVQKLLVYDCLKIAMTATLPKSKEEQLSCCLGEHFEVHREPTARLNVKYIVKDYQNLNERQLGTMLISNLKQGLSGIVHDGKIIIYCMSRLEAEELKEMITVQVGACSLYHSGLSKSEKEHQHVQWLTTVRIMIATSAFTMGIDYPRVVTVFVLIGMYGVWELEQCAGRIRRDGQEGEFIVITSSPIMKRRMSRFEDDKLEDVNDLQTFLFGDECRRVLIGTLLDNVTKRCSDYDTDTSRVVYCDICEQERNGNTETYYLDNYMNQTTNYNQDIFSGQLGKYIIVYENIAR